MIARHPCGTGWQSVPLLPSGPGGVRDLPLRRTQLSTAGGLHRANLRSRTNLMADACKLQPAEFRQRRSRLQWRFYRRRWRLAFAVAIKLDDGERRTDTEDWPDTDGVCS